MNEKDLYSSVAIYTEKCTCKGYIFPDGSTPEFFNNIKKAYKRFLELRDAKYYGIHIDGNHILTFHGKFCECTKCGVKYHPELYNPEYIKLLKEFNWI